MTKEQLAFFTMRIPVEMKKKIKKCCVDLNIAMKEFCLEALRKQLIHIEKQIENQGKDNGNVSRNSS